MSVDRSEGRRTNHRAFRPTLDGGLESRLLLSKLPPSFFLKHPNAGAAFENKQPPYRNGTHAHPFPIASVPRGPAVSTEVAHGGQSVVVATPDGSRFEISLTYYNQPTPTGATVTTQSPIQGQTPGAGAIQAQGTVRAYAMSGGRVGLILDGTTNLTEMTISSLPQTQRKGYAHSFAYGQAAESHILNIGQITVNTGEIGAIEGFHTADLSGPLTALGTVAVDRIAFEDLLPGASIQTGGDLNTLDILDNVNLDSGPGIVIGRDLNLFNVGQDINLSNGASIKIGRYLGATPQPPKGTSTGSNFLAQNQALLGTGTSTTLPSLSGYVQGSVTIGPGSTFEVGSGIANSSVLASTTVAPSVFLVNGFVNAPDATNLAIPNLLLGNNFSVVVGTAPNQQTVFFNFVARNGSNYPTFISTT